MPTPKKATEIDLIESRLRNAQAAILADYRGLTVAQIGTLRGALRPSGGEFHVVKNTLARIAADRIGIEGLNPLLEGPTAILFANDDISGPARALQDAIRTLPVLRPKAVLIGKTVGPPEQVRQLAELPTKPQLQATLVGTIQGSLSQLVGTLNGAVANVVYVLEARVRQQEEQPAAA